MNKFNRHEWAGAFGDLGTLVPFTIAYVTLLDIDPGGLLFVLGVCQIVVGSYYKTPFPVQPMKAIGAVATTQAAQTLSVTPSTVFAAGLATGVIWLILGATGLASRVAGIVARPIMLGIVLGLGIAFMLSGIGRISEGWLLGATGLFGTLLLLTNKRFPAMLLLLGFGAAVAVTDNPQMNLFGSTFSGIPMCHGAGGMAGHVRFGATTGGATVIIGSVLVLISLFVSDSVVLLFQIIPVPVLGVILFLTGAQLALGACDQNLSRMERFTLYSVAAVTMWNVGVAFVYGLIVHALLKRGMIRL